MQAIDPRAPFRKGHELRYRRADAGVCVGIANLASRCVRRAARPSARNRASRTARDERQCFGDARSTHRRQQRARVAARDERAGS